MEIVLQAHTLAGFPRSINALIKISELGIHAEGTKFLDEVHDVAVWRKAGRDTLDAVYGSVSEKMRDNFRKMHPLLEMILVEHIYGRMLSRPLVDLRIRELCSLAIIAGQNLPLQLVRPPHLRAWLSQSPLSLAVPPAARALRASFRHAAVEIPTAARRGAAQVSHLRGSVRCGATREEVRPPPPPSLHHPGAPRRPVRRGPLPDQIRDVIRNMIRDVIRNMIRNMIRGVIRI